jgi:FolB domain-containing protein
MDEVFIKDLTVQAIIGVYAWEREKPQNILINIRMFTDTSLAARTDNIDDCIDYGAMTRAIVALVENKSRFTVEALAEEIACLCLEHPSAKSVIVRVEKPGVVTGTASVGIQIER